MNALSSSNNFMSELRRNMHDPHWLNEHEEKIFRMLKDECIKEHRISDMVTILQQLVPHYLKQPTHYQWEQLIRYFLDIAEYGKVNDALGQAHLMFGQYMLGSSDVRQAVTSFWQACQHAKQAQNDEERIRAYIQLLQTDVFHIGSTWDTTETRAQLKAFADENPDPITRAIIYFSLGAYHIKRSEYEQAELLATEALKLERQTYQRQHDVLSNGRHNTRTRLIEAEALVGIVYRHQGLFDQAQKHLENALGHCDRRLHHYQLGIIKSEKGWIAYYRGNIQDGIDYVREAQSYYKDIQHPILIAMADHTLGIMLTNDGAYDEALAHLDKARHVYSSTRNFVNMIDIIHTIGYIHMFQHKWELALAKYSRAKEYAYRHLGHMKKRQQQHIDAINEDIATLEQMRQDADSDAPSV
jgi:tetratricopeptide (TPR) repeat protein